MDNSGSLKEDKFSSR